MSAKLKKKWREDEKDLLTISIKMICDWPTKKKLHTVVLRSFRAMALALSANFVTLKFSWLRSLVRVMIKVSPDPIPSRSWNSVISSYFATSKQILSEVWDGILISEQCMLTQIYTLSTIIQIHILVVNMSQ